MFDVNSDYMSFDMVTGASARHNKDTNPNLSLFAVADLPHDQADKRVISIIVQYRAGNSRSFDIKPWFNVIPYSKFYYEGLIGKKTYANTHLTIGFDGLSNDQPQQNSAFPHMAQAYKLAANKDLERPG
jgi:hypothetical protein